MKLDRRLAPWLVAAASAAAFLPALRNGFVSWDDRVILVQNPYFRGLGWENLKWMFSNFTTGKYQPLSWLSFGVDYCLWGMNPAGYHLTALLLHSANAALLYLVALRLLGGGERASFGAACAALFWALHPLRVESVAWATERGDPLSGLFYLLTAWLYLERRLGWCALAYACGLLSKATGISWPAVLLVLDVYPLRRWDGKDAAKLEPLLVEKIPMAALALAFALVGLKGQSTTRALVGLGRFSLRDRLAQFCYDPVFYLAKTLWPARLSQLYVLSPRLQPLPFLLAAAALIAGTYLIWRRRRVWPWAAAAWAAYLIALLPVAGLVKLGIAIAADRYTYLPSMALAALFGAAALRFASLRWLAPLILVALGVASAAQTGVWHDSLGFWSRAVELDPDCYVCHQNLADALTAAGHDEEGKQHAIQGRLLLAKARHEIGVSYYESGDYEQAAVRFAEALEAVPNLPETQNDMGLSLFRLGRVSEAALYFQQAVAEKPDFVEARINWADALAAEGITHQARLQFQKALQLDPSNQRAAAGLRMLEAPTAK